MALSSPRLQFCGASAFLVSLAAAQLKDTVLFINALMALECNRAQAELCQTRWVPGQHCELVYRVALWFVFFLFIFFSLTQGKMFGTHQKTVTPVRFSEIFSRLPHPDFTLPHSSPDSSLSAPFGNLKAKVGPYFFFCACYCCFVNTCERPAL